MVKKSLYVCRSVLNSEDLIEWAKQQGLKKCLHSDEYHVTIAYSKTPVDWANWSPIENKFIYERSDRTIKKFGDCIVLSLESNKLSKRWQEFIDGGCSWDYEEYQPHVTITYDGADIDPDNIEPFMGKIVFGEEQFSKIESNVVSSIQHISLDESVFRLNDTNKDELYDKFKNTYEKATGTSWTKEKFLSRARYWEFYGSENGFITLRPQRSGFYKLTGMAGSPEGILRAMEELQATHLPVWGAVSETLARVAKRKEMIVPHTITGGPMILKAIINNMPESVLGGNKPIVNKDGSISMDLGDEIGNVTKYFVCNKEYLSKLLKMPEFLEKISVVPGAKMFFKLFGISI
jgi:2'-5' RNA ligase